VSGQHLAPTDLALAADGPAAPPRSNGEIVFDAPWQSRAFGVAAALAEGGTFAWSDFQAALIHEVGTADVTGVDTGTADGYWSCWLAALGSLTEANAIVEPAVWSARCDELAARPAGHDH
jgi:nitrile hydratase accessory protein